MLDIKIIKNLYQCEEALLTIHVYNNWSQIFKLCIKEEGTRRTRHTCNQSQSCANKMCTQMLCTDQGFWQLIRTKRHIPVRSAYRSFCNKNVWAWDLELLLKCIIEKPFFLTQALAYKKHACCSTGPTSSSACVFNNNFTACVAARLIVVLYLVRMYHRLLAQIMTLALSVMPSRPSQPGPTFDTSVPPRLFVVMGWLVVLMKTTILIHAIVTLHESTYGVK